VDHSDEARGGRRRQPERAGEDLVVGRGLGAALGGLPHLLERDRQRVLDQRPAEGAARAPARFGAQERVDRGDAAAWFGPCVPDGDPGSFALGAGHGGPAYYRLPRRFPGVQAARDGRCRRSMAGWSRWIPRNAPPSPPPPRTGWFGAE